MKKNEWKKINQYIEIKKMTKKIALVQMHWVAVSPLFLFLQFLQL